MPELSDTSFFSDPSNNDQGDDERLSFQPDEDYRINLSVFEGPVDLLLYLIRKKELDIHEISLTEIVREYLDYVEIIKLIDIERAGDFIVVASTLMKIKSRSLFSSQDDETEGQDGDDPRQSLIRYLMEYEKFGDVAEKLGEKEDERRGVFPRGGEKSRVAQYVDEKETAPDFMLFDMLTALKDVMKNAPKTATHEVKLLNITSEMKQREILEELGRTQKIDFIKLVTGQPKIIIVVTFVALLELIKSRKIQIRQSKQFSRITITLREDAKDKGDDIKTETETE
jgi:segregation and condensation protein A